MNLNLYSKALERGIEKKKKVEKRKLFVNSKIQFTHIFNILLFQIISFASILVTGSWLLFFKIDHNVTTAKDPEIVKAMIIVLVILNLGAFIWSVLFLRSVAGPVKKIQIVLRQIAAGDIPAKEIKFRKNDFFKEILPDLNSAIGKINHYKNNN